jgi:hypothetical protein
MQVWVRRAILERFTVDVEVLFQTCGRLDG